jgi:hypothetical protein
MSFALLLALAAQAAPTRIGTGPVLADGTTPAEIRIWLGETDKKAKITAETGVVTSVEEPGDGTAIVHYLPPALTAPGNLVLEVALDRSPVRIEVPALPAPGGSLAVTVEPALVPVGGTAVVTVRPPAGTPRISLSASSGTLDAPIAQPDGSFTAKFTPPRDAPAQAVLFTASAADSPDVWGSGVGRVMGRRKLTAQAPTGVPCALRVGTTTSEPVVASGGSVTLTYDADPAATTAVLEIRRAGSAYAEKEVEIPAGTGALAFAPGPATRVAGAALVRLLAVDAAGAPRAGTPVVTAGGKEVPVEAAGAGWNIRLDLVSGPLEVAASLDGLTAKTKLTAVALPTFTAEITPVNLPPKGKATAVLTAHGPAAPAVVWLLGSGSTLKASGGAFTSRATVTDKLAAVQAEIGPKLASTGAPAAAIAGDPEWPVVRSGGEVAIRVAVVDAGGLPVVGQPVKVAITGDARPISTDVTTDALGIARVPVVAGPAPGPFAVRFDAGRVWTEVAVLTVGDSGGPDIYPPPQGAAARWLGTVRPVATWREGSAPIRPPVLDAATLLARAAAAAVEPAKVRKVKPASDARHPALMLLASDALGGASFDGDGVIFPAEGSYSTAAPGSLGATLDVGIPVGGHQVLTARGTARAEAWGAELDRGTAPQLDLRGGGRWQARGELAPAAGLAIARISGLALRFTPSGGREGFTVARAAVRPELGLRLPVSALDLRTSLGVSLGPEPLEESVEILAALGDPGETSPIFALSIEHLGWTVERGAISGALSQTRLVLGVGARFGG